MADEPELERMPRWQRGCLWTLVALIAAFLLAPIGAIRWDGGFPSQEYRLQFVTADGQPVPGVRMEVFTQAGGRCYLYPVEEYVPDNPILTDADGRMTFRHFGRSLEYGGRTTTNVTGIKYHDDGDPQYDCAFVLDGREVHRVRFNSLIPRDQKNRTVVLRTWRLSEWVTRELSNRGADWKEMRFRLFNGNRDGQLDREERIAAGYFFRYADRDEVEKAYELEVAERTIVLPSR